MHPAHLQSFSTLCLVCVSPFSTSADDWHLSGLFLAIVETSSGFRSNCYWTDRNRANTENICIGLVFVVLAQWKLLYCIDRFKNIKANKSRLINKYIYTLIHGHLHIGLVIFPIPPYWPETESKFSHPGKITGYWITTRSFPYRDPYCPDQYGPRLRLRPIWFNTWAFPYWPGYHPSTHIGPRLRLGMITRPIWKCPCINLYLNTCLKILKFYENFDIFFKYLKFWNFWKILNFKTIFFFLF